MFARTLALRRGFGYLLSFALLLSALSAVIYLFPSKSNLFFALLACCSGPSLFLTASVMAVCSFACFMQSVESLSKATDLAAACWSGGFSIAATFASICMHDGTESPTRLLLGDICGFSASILFASFLLCFACYLHRCGNDLGIDVMAQIWFAFAIVGALLFAVLMVQSYLRFRILDPASDRDSFAAWAGDCFALFYPPFSAVYFGKVWNRLRGFESGTREFAAEPSFDRDINTRILSEHAVKRATDRIKQI
jgi:hypothetical protein